MSKEMDALADATLAATAEAENAKLKNSIQSIARCRRT
jgi:hypothetical protein